MAAVTLDSTISRSQNGRHALRLSPCTPGAMGAAADLLTVALTPVFLLSLIRVTVLPATASILSARIAPSGAAVVTAAANSGTALSAGAAFSFLLPANSASTYNFRFTLAITVDLLMIEELEGE